MSEQAPTRLHRPVITVPQRQVNGGFDSKFEADPYEVKCGLQGLITATDYKDTITLLNDRLKPYRSKKVDAALLVTGVLMVPLAVWAVRNKHLAGKRRRVRTMYILEFNGHNPALFMRWNRSQSTLTIERRNVNVHGEAPPVEIVTDAVAEYAPPDQTGPSSWDERTPLFANTVAIDKEPKTFD